MISAGSFFILPLGCVCVHVVRVVLLFTHLHTSANGETECSHTLMTHRFVGTPGLFPSVYPHGDLSSSSTPPGVFSLGVPVDDLFFIGNQLVATSHTGKVGVWNAVTQHWQV